MKRFLCHTLGGVALALGLSLSAPVLAQETITHPDATLQTINHGASTWSNVLTTSVTTVNGGGHKSLSVTGNTVRLISGTPDRVYGAFNSGDTDGLNGNSAVIDGGTVGGAGGYVAGAYHTLINGNTSVTNNRVEINGGTVNVTTGGGVAMSNLDGDALANGNTVVITGGTVEGWVVGGQAYSKSGQTEASNNTVRIGPGLPTTTFGSNVWLYGGRAYTDTGIIVSTGNTLQIESAGLSVLWLESFQRFEFTLPANLANGGTVLTGTNTVRFGTNTVVTVNAAPGFSVSPGDRFTLIDCAGCTFTGTVAATSESGVIAGHFYTLVMENGHLVLRVGNSVVLPPPLPPPPEVLPGPTREYSGQWIKDDENAWGLTVLMNFPTNPRLLFVPWYTYDSSGEASWYVFQGDNWTDNDTITAEVRRYTGPSWGIMPYDNTRIAYTIAGTATLTFTSVTSARFQYSVEGTSRTVTLSRLDGAPPGTVGQYTGQWIKADEDGWGLTVLRTFPSNPNYVFVPWYTYDSSGKASWYVFQSDSLEGGDTVSANVYRYTGSPWGVMPYDNSAVSDAAAGTASLTFTSPATARFEYDVEGARRTIDLVKLE